MDRRSFLKGVSAAGPLILAASAVPAIAGRRNHTSRRPHRVAVIGAGIVGACIAYNLARRGCDVLVVDERGPAAQASGNSFAWINGGDGEQSLGYHLLRSHAMAEHRQLGQLLGLPVRWGGGLEWHDEAEATQAMVQGARRMQERGSALRLLNAQELARIEPNLQVAANWRGAFGEHDGALDSAGATRIVINHALRAGAHLQVPVHIREIRRQQKALSLVADEASFTADRVVIAAGVGSSAILSSLGVSLPQHSKPGIIVTTRPMVPILNTVLYGPGVHMHQRSDGRVIVGEKAGAPQAEPHLEQLVATINTFPTTELAEQHAGRILALAQSQVPALASAEIESVGIGWRPMPPDGLPVVGSLVDHPDIYVALMHSGVTLGPLIGRLAAMEILDGVDAGLLSEFRLERFQGVA